MKFRKAGSSFTPDGRIFVGRAIGFPFRLVTLPFGFLWRREKGSPQERGILGEWPVARPSDWLSWLNQPQTEGELSAIRESITRGRPYGEPLWQATTAMQLNLEAAFRLRGRPKK